MWKPTFEHFSSTSSLNCRNFSWMAGWLRAKDRKCVKGCFLRKLSRSTSIRVRAEMTPLRCCPVITAGKHSNTSLLSWSSLLLDPGSWGSSRNQNPQPCTEKPARLPAWLKMPDTAVLSSAKTGWCHQKHPSAVQKVSSEGLKYSNWEPINSGALQISRALFQVFNRQSEWKSQGNLSRIKMVRAICARTSRHQTENTWAWQERTARSKLSLASYYYVLSTSLNLPNSPSQFSGRSQDLLPEKHHHVPVQHHSGILPALPPHRSVTNITAHRASNLWSMP